METSESKSLSRSAKKNARRKQKKEKTKEGEVKGEKTSLSENQSNEGTEEIIQSMERTLVIVVFESASKRLFLDFRRDVSNGNGFVS